jgi:AcrR family transcriptional regulator
MDKSQLIISTALALFVENGFHGTATSKIAQEANVANGTLFNYFPTKDILIVSIYNNIIQKLDQFIIESIDSHSVSKEAFRSIFRASLQWNIENPIEYKYLQQFNNSPYCKTVNTTKLNDEEQPLYILIQNAINVVLLKPLPVGFIFCLFTSQINGLYNYLISNGFPEEQISLFSEDTFELLWKMIED